MGGVVCDNTDYSGTSEGIGTLAAPVECPGGREWDGRSWYQRPFEGGLFEIGLGWPLRNYRVVPFTRLRAQLTTGSTTPTTFWGSLQGGVQFNLGEIVCLHLGYGIAFYHDSVDPIGQEENDGSHVAAYFDLGLAFFVGRSEGSATAAVLQLNRS